MLIIAWISLSFMALAAWVSYRERKREREFLARVRMINEQAAVERAIMLRRRSFRAVMGGAVQMGPYHDEEVPPSSGMRPKGSWSHG